MLRPMRIPNFSNQMKDIYQISKKAGERTSECNRVRTGYPDGGFLMECFTGTTFGDLVIT